MPSLHARLPDAARVAHALLIVLSLSAPLTVGAQPAASPAASPLAVNNIVQNAVIGPAPAGALRQNTLPLTTVSEVSILGTANSHLGAREPFADRALSARDFGARRINGWQDKAPRAPWVAPLSSLVIPGSGQGLLGQQRSVAYLVVEAFLIIRSSQAYHADQNARKRYRTLAADVARAEFGASRPDGAWEYYEEMGKYEASGAFDKGTAGVFTPESDVSTFNGKQWELAREQFWDIDHPPATNAPEYQRALNYYKSRAVQGSFMWSWRDNSLYQTAFLEAIDESNNSNQRYVTTIGFVAANHLVSLIDAYVTVRLRRYGGAGLSAASVNTKLLPMGVNGARGYGMAMGVTIPVTGWR